MIDKVGSCVSFTYQICSFYLHFELSVGEHTRGCRRAYARMVASVRAYGRQQTHENAVVNYRKRSDTAGLSL